MKSVMQHQFGQTPQSDIPRSSFDLSFGYKTTFDAGKLIPLRPIEVLPGDTFNINLNAFARLSTPIHPIMDNIHLDHFFFYVPTRLVWDNFKKFMGEQTDPGDSIDYTIPKRTTTYVPASGSIPDYMGVPIGKDVANKMNILPIRSFWLCYDEWFRDQNLQDSADVDRGDTQTVTKSASYVWTLPPSRGKRYDYFTQALPFPQKGDAIDIPIGTSAPVTTDVGPATNLSVYTGSAYAEILTSTTDAQLGGAGLEANRLYADLSNATAATINQLRQAFQIQRLLEKDARGGTRFIEVIKNHFNTTNPDFRLQRPEYLGGGTTTVNITPISQTSETGTTPQGTLAAMGTASINGRGITKSFTEWGYIIPIVNVRADLTYQQGIERIWSRETRYDFYWPSLAHIGEQAILNKEIYFQANPTDEDVFGYVPRYDEYRYLPSLVTGLFRSDASGSLDAWHLAQDFAALPVLDSTFIEDNPPIDRVVAVPSEPHFIFDSYFSIRAARPIPLHGVPGLIDHF